MKTAIIITRKGDSTNCTHFESASEARAEFRKLKGSDAINSLELWDSSSGRVKRIRTGGFKTVIDAGPKFHGEDAESEAQELPESPDAKKRGRKSQSSK